ncbi:hypothetical protein ACIBKY_00755 [Nonomuraea sp. NPDC050394]|uniref:hypothetical protein n=1 Tax=Nonomuraea sp. NPDC050394 TaxID=3364363 RepID=UPI0037934052
MPIGEVIAHLDASGVAIEVGPAPRTGALGEMTSVYFRDPDGKPIEVSTYWAAPSDIRDRGVTSAGGRR